MTAPARYAGQEATWYLLSRFGFEFTDTEDLAVQELQEALFMHALEIARRRTGLVRMMQSQEENFGYVRKSIESGKGIWHPLGEGPARDPYSAAARIEDEERYLSVWCKAVAAIQARHAA